MTDNWNFSNAEYTISRELPGVGYDDAIERTKAALKTQGFGVLTEIDMKATMKTKLDVDLPPYMILGACNPSLALKAVTAEHAVGALLPCNVVVAQADGGSTVAAIHPQKMFSVVDRQEVAPIADEVEKLLRAAIEAI